MSAGGTQGDDQGLAASLLGGAASGSTVHTERDPMRAYSGTLTFRDLIRRNKRDSFLLIVFMIVLGVALGCAIAAPIGVMMWTPPPGAVREWDIIPIIDSPTPAWQDLLPSIVTGGVAALVAGIIAALWAWYGGAGAILSISGAKPIEKSADPQLFNVVEELSIAAGIPMPRVYLIPSEALNAFATGRDPKHAAVAITSGLRQRLTRDELAGVIAHELSHVRNYDIRFSLLMATMVGLIVFFSDFFRRSLLRSLGRSSGSSKKGGAGLVLLIALAVALVFSIVAPIIATLLHLAFSRQREYLADAGAVELTRYPAGLASALRKLADSKVMLPSSNRATEHLYIIRPLNDEDGDGEPDRHNLDSIFSTHPPIEKRIERLMALER